MASWQLHCAYDTTVQNNRGASFLGALGSQTAENNVDGPWHRTSWDFSRVLLHPDALPIDEFRDIGPELPLRSVRTRLPHKVRVTSATAYNETPHEYTKRHRILATDWLRVFELLRDAIRQCAAQLALEQTLQRQ